MPTARQAQALRRPCSCFPDLQPSSDLWPPAPRTGPAPLFLKAQPLPSVNDLIASLIRADSQGLPPTSPRADNMKSEDKTDPRRGEGSQATTCSAGEGLCGESENKSEQLELGEVKAQGPGASLGLGSP